MYKLLFPIVILSFIFSCQESTKSDKEISPDLSKADSIVALAIAVHGGEKYETAGFRFVFREKAYTFRNQGEMYVYTVSGKDKNGLDYADKIENGKFIHRGTELSEKEKENAMESLNSVLYFALLPYKLKDKAVNKEWVETTTIKGQNYEVISVTFKQEGGGKDFDDEFHYWINRETHAVDYLAYNYQVNGGGVRFRSAYNVRTIDLVRFQDYINYGAPVGTPLKDLPALFEQEKLDELSRIETENVLKL